MKNLIIIITSIVFLYLVKLRKIELANGKKNTEKKFRKITRKEFEEIFGKMASQELSLLFDDDKITVDTIKTIDSEMD